MLIFPAIDLRRGRCVRLVRGAAGAEIVFDEDPAAVAARFAAAGASWLHVIDLDGALEESAASRAALRRLFAATSLPVQLGGGIRDDERAAAAFALGARRVIVGTRALADPAWARALAAAHPGGVVAAVDHRDGEVLDRGWTRGTGRRLEELLAEADGWGLAALLVTDAGRDGTLEGCDTGRLAAAIRGLRTPVIAAGGVTTAADVARLAALPPPLAGAVIGRALYAGTISLEEAIRVAGGGN